MIPAFLADRENRKRRGEGSPMLAYINGDPIPYEPDEDDDIDEPDGPVGDEQLELPLMEGKGGAPAAPPPPDPMREAEAREWEAKQQFERDERRRIAEKAEADRQAAEKLQKWQTGRSGAREAATRYGRQQLAARGMENDPYGIMAAYNNQLDFNNSRLQDLDAYDSAFGTSVWDEVYNNQRGIQRGQINRTLDQAIAEDIADTRFTGTADDSILDAILGTQYGEAETDLLNAKNRGQLNDAAYQRALTSLGGKKSSARSELEDIGGGVLAGYRTDVGSQRRRLEDRVTNWDFGDTFDVDSERTKFDALLNEKSGRMEGDIRRAIGDRRFFDTNTLIGQANAAGGAQNAGTITPTTGNNALYSVFQDQEERNSGNQGAF